MDRSQLEMPRTPEQMLGIISRVTTDLIAFPNDIFYQRRGIVKDVLEEYYPLYLLASHFGEDSRAKLNTKSARGADGFIEDPDHKTIKVQITSANLSYQERLNREQLSQGRMVFSHQNKERNRTTGEIIASGRVLTTKTAQLLREINYIINSIKAKCENYIDYTDVLLVDSNISHLIMVPDIDWCSEVTNQLLAVGNIPYEHIYICYKSESGPQLFIAK